MYFLPKALSRGRWPTTIGVKTKLTDRSNPLIQRGFAVFSVICKNQPNWPNKPVIIIFYQIPWVESMMPLTFHTFKVVAGAKLENSPKPSNLEV
jgi:hypothetical protein